MNISIPLLHLSLIENIGPSAIQKILGYANVKQLETLYQYHRSEFIQCGLSEKQADVVITGLQNIQILEKELILLQKHAIKVVSILDDHYPAHLKEIHVPPAILYYKGADLAHAHKSLAVIGSRKANQYGQHSINTLIPPLVEKQWTIVSGGALGADTMAHKKTVECKGKTIVVLGSGLLQLYPSSNKRLFDAILAHNGTIISSFPLQTSAFPGNFPARNRIIAGLSKGCIVIQAAAKSGTRITAEFALEQGRDVFAVPGPFDDPLSAGCHRLIQEGAYLISSAHDILQTYGESHVVEQHEKKDSNEQETQREKAQSMVSATYVRAAPVLTCPLQEKIVVLCQTPQSLEYIMMQVALSLPETQGLLFDMQLAGYIEQDFTGQWVRQ